MKTRLLPIALVAAISILFAGCKKEDPVKDKGKPFIEAKVVNGDRYNSLIDSVVADYGNKTKAKYENGGFAITPGKVSPEHLEALNDGLPEGITMSDPTAKVASFSSLKANKQGRHAGGLVLTTQTDKEIADEGYSDEYDMIVFYYADKKVTISGSNSKEKDGVTKTIKFNTILNQGWNYVMKREVKSFSEELLEYSTTFDLSKFKWQFYY